eukprot:762608-Hanusia_phi.AAC.2
MTKDHTAERSKIHLGAREGCFLVHAIASENQGHLRSDGAADESLNLSGERFRFGQQPPSSTPPVKEADRRRLPSSRRRSASTSAGRGVGAAGPDRQS